MSQGNGRSWGARTGRAAAWAAAVSLGCGLAAAGELPPDRDARGTTPALHVASEAAGNVEASRGSRRDTSPGRRSGLADGSTGAAAPSPKDAARRELDLDRAARDAATEVLVGARRVAKRDVAARIRSLAEAARRNSTDAEEAARQARRLAAGRSGRSNEALERAFDLRRISEAQSELAALETSRALAQPAAVPAARAAAEARWEVTLARARQHVAFRQWWADPTFENWDRWQKALDALALADKIAAARG